MIQLSSIGLYLIHTIATYTQTLPAPHPKMHTHTHTNWIVKFIHTNFIVKTTNIWEKRASNKNKIKFLLNHEINKTFSIVDSINTNIKKLV